MQNNNCKNETKLSDNRVAELHAVANEMRKHRLEWNGFLSDPSTLILELAGEAADMEQIFETLRGFNNQDSFYNTFNEVFAAYFTAHPENAQTAFNAFSKLSNLMRLISLNSNLIERQAEYYSNLSNQAEQLEIQ